MKEDFGNAQNGNDFVVIAFDLQQVLPAPHVNVNVAFYCRQQWTYNLCFHGSTGQSHVCVRMEDQADR